jgi:hypothetical protein
MPVNGRLIPRHPVVLHPNHLFFFFFFFFFSEERGTGGCATGNTEGVGDINSPFTAPSGISTNKRATSQLQRRGLKPTCKLIIDSRAFIPKIKHGAATAVSKESTT